MNKQLKSILGGLLFSGAIAFAPNADAGFFVGAQKVTRIVMADSPSNFAFVDFDGTRTANPACTSSHPTKFIFDTSTSRGKALLSILTAAMYAQRPIVGSGLNTCTSATFGPGGGSQSIENLRHVEAQR
jgi:hypothetical protein